MVDKYIDFNSLKLELMRFSEYLEFDEEKEKNSCSGAIEKIETLQKQLDNLQKYITVLVVSENKLIDHIRKKLDDFKLDFLEQYASCDKESIEIHVYCFDITDRSDKRLYHQFNSIVDNRTALFKKIYISKFTSLLGTSIIVFASLVLFFTHMGLNAFGVNTSMVNNIPELSFLLLTTFMLLIFSVSFVYLFLPVWLPIVFGFLLFNYFSTGNILLENMWMIIVLSILLVTIPWLLKKLPQTILDDISNTSIYVKIAKLSQYISNLSIVRNSIDFSISISFFVLMVMYVFIVAIVFVPSASSVILPKFFKHLWKGNYEMVAYVYQNSYSGYPKILIDKKDKTYYVPFENNGYYYAYDIDMVKEKYFKILKKDDKAFVTKVCSDNQKKQEFMRYYIINNPYIKVLHQNNLRFKIDSNQTVIDANKSEPLHIKSFLITEKDIDKTLCDAKIVK